jgi:radical SAM protein with 4Fe4S-binding SPASM domain
MSKKIFHIEESKVFCMAPFMHIHNVPTGDILPCCISLGEPMGNLYKENIEDIWNNNRYKELRQDLLNDKPSNHCTRCYKEEEWGNTSSIRRSYNDRFKDFYKELIEQNTSLDGGMSTMKFLRWDFRFNNLCNLACTVCHPTYSSTWVPIMKAIDPTYKEEQFNSSKQHKDNFVNTIKSQVGHVEEIYFAGGEPLLHSEHYEILKYLEDANRLDKVEFTYSTNLTTMTYKSTEVIDYWKKMQKIRVLVSLDEVDSDRLFYIRYPAIADKILNNIKILKDNLVEEHHHWVITPTWSLMNIHRIKDILEYFLNNDLLPHSFYNTSIWESDYHNIVLLNPEYFSIRSANKEWKEYLRNKIAEYEQWYYNTLLPLKSSDKLKTDCRNVFDERVGIIKNALEEDVKFDVNWYLDYLKKLDKERNTDFKKTFPELIWHTAERP